MVILDFIRRAPAADLRRMLIPAVAAGFSSALLVVMINHVAAAVATGRGPGLVNTVIFAACFLLYYQSNRLALLRANAVIERLLKELRVQVMDKLRKSELKTVDGLGRGHLYALVSQETNHLSVAFPLLVDCFQQAILLVVSLIYLAHLSTASFIVYLLAVAAGIWSYWQINVDFRHTLRQTVVRQGRMLDVVGDIVNGFKELRLNGRRSAAALAGYETASGEARASLAESGEHWASMILLFSFVTYFALGAIGFILPQYITAHGAVVFQLVPTLLFCFGPLVKIVAQSPMFMQAAVGLQAILDVERRLDAGGAISPAEARAAAPQFHDFKRISYVDLGFSHRDAHGEPLFTTGPLNLTLDRGEVLFIVGGNGSGKSTTLRLVTGLYPPDSGQIRVDGTAVEGRAVAGFRELFSAVFADFHLFDRLYGLENVDPVRVQDLIAEMGLSHKVSFANGQFSQTSLSTGQRKRLALIAALLEDRPVYVFDEWSAEQDVHFRQYFYARILADLKQRGKTIIVVTHDERYWHHADRVVRLDLGTVLWDRPGEEWIAP